MVFRRGSTATTPTSAQLQRPCLFERLQIDIFVSFHLVNDSRNIPYQYAFWAIEVVTRKAFGVAITVTPIDKVTDAFRSILQEI